MGYSLIHYLKNLPLQYYLEGGFIQIRGPTISLFLSTRESAALVCRGHRAYGFEAEIANLPDAPPVNGVDSDRGIVSASRTFSEKLLTRSRANGVPRFIFVPDLGSSDLYCNVHNVANLRELNVETLLESLNEDPRQVFGSWDESRRFRWAVFNTQLEAVQGVFERRIQEVIIVGIPADHCEQLEAWTDTQRGTLLGIVPLPLACLKWFCASIPLGRKTAFILLMLEHAVLLAVVQDQKVVLFRQYIEDPEFVYHEIPVLASELRAEEFEIFVWSSRPVSEDVAVTLAGTELTGEVLRQINGRAVVVRKSDGSKLELNGPIPHLLLWLENRIA
jgi:hypothetical protein